jgi:hypothetical protein
MEANFLNYIVIYDNVDESKLNHYESIFRVCKNSIEKNNYLLIFINNNEKINDILCKNETLLEGLVSGRIDIYSGNNIINFLKKSFCIFYFLDYKDDFFTRNMEEIINLNKFILHKPMDKYKALINVLKGLNNDVKHKYNQSNFLKHYNNLYGSNELNDIFKMFKNKFENNNILENNNQEQNKNQEQNNQNNEIKKIKLIKKVNKEELENIKEENENNENENNENENNENENNENENNENNENKNNKNENKINKNENKINENKKSIQKNINVTLNKVNNLNMNHIYVTFYDHTEHQITNDIQIKCIIENCKNKLFNKFLIFNNNNNEMLLNYFKNELNEELINSIIFIKNDDLNTHAFKINKVINYLNTNYLGDIVYLCRSDILIPIQNEIKNIQSKLLEHNYIYAISRVERKLDGTMFKESTFNNLLYSHLQDLYIFKVSLNIDLNNNNQIYNELDFYEHNFEILFNKILEDSGYNIINDTINCKIFRIMCSNNVNERHIMKKNNINYKDNNCSYIAENSILNKFTLENYLNNLDLNEEEIYLVKQYIFKLFIKKNNII